MLSNKEIKDFLGTFLHIQFHVNKTAIEKGWWDEPRSDGECIALMHSELSEALEGARQDNPKSDKISCSALEEELADTIIRIMDFAQDRGLNIPGAIIEKMTYNENREYKHGGKKF